MASAKEQSIPALERRLAMLSPRYPEWLPRGLLLEMSFELDGEGYAWIRGWDVGVAMHPLKDVWELMAVYTTWLDGHVDADGDLNSPQHESAEAALESWKRFHSCDEPAADWAASTRDDNWEDCPEWQRGPMPLREAPFSIRMAGRAHLKRMLDGIEERALLRSASGQRRLARIVARDSDFELTR